MNLKMKILNHKVYTLQALLEIAKLGFPCGSAVKDPYANAGDVDSVSGWRRSPGEGNSNSLQYSCLENSRNREAWLATVRTVHGVTKSWTQVSD